MSYNNAHTSHACWFEITFGFNHEYNDIRIQPGQDIYKGVKQFRVADNFRRVTDKGVIEAVVEFGHQNSGRYALYRLLKVLQRVEVIERYLGGCYYRCFKIFGEFDSKKPGIWHGFPPTREL